MKNKLFGRFLRGEEALSSCHIFSMSHQSKSLNTPLSRVDQIDFLDIFLGSIEEKGQPSVLHLIPGAGAGLNAEMDLPRSDAVFKNY